MQRIEYRFTDKTAWGPGAWQDEPDKVQWTDEATGLPCLIVRGPVGALCGYVGVAEGHPLFGKSSDEADVEVHGGLTFAEFCAEDEEHGICHEVEPGENDRVWWLGFDCAHYRDLSPGGNRYSSEVYRNLAYVQGECASLARQLAGMDQWPNQFLARTTWKRPIGSLLSTAPSESAVRSRTSSGSTRRRSRG